MMRCYDNKNISHTPSLVLRVKPLDSGHIVRETSDLCLEVVSIFMYNLVSPQVQNLMSIVELRFLIVHPLEMII